ncbi:hypothetical protein [Arthrobacter sp. ISL-69]|uniref:hypothetical protein n=1 Tax=Arthrobacter sp. ISL-69 TaxID=2819113 RepID=UPI001BECB7A2|nr:hypothetical protein [Arthrobacter sp. ISL-69]MBT2538773.1 hypothetical protein [Arthrobacter sp. ISL-69]
MNSLNDSQATTGSEELEATISQFADRCYALPPRKQQFLLGILAPGPAIHIETFALLLLMLEDSDDDFNITNPELNDMIARAHETHDSSQEPT